MAAHARVASADLSLDRDHEPSLICERGVDRELDAAVVDAQLVFDRRLEDQPLPQRQRRVSAQASSSIGLRPRDLDGAEPDAGLGALDARLFARGAARAAERERTDDQERRRVSQSDARKASSASRSAAESAPTAADDVAPSELWRAIASSMVPESPSCM